MTTDFPSSAPFPPDMPTPTPYVVGSTRFDAYSGFVPGSPLPPFDSRPGRDSGEGIQTRQSPPASPDAAQDDVTLLEQHVRSLRASYLHYIAGPLERLLARAARLSAPDARHHVLLALDVDTARHLAEEAMRLHTTPERAAMHILHARLMADRRGADVEGMPIGASLHRTAVDHWIVRCRQGGSNSGSTAQRALDGAPWTQKEDGNG